MKFHFKCFLLLLFNPNVRDHHDKNQRLDRLISLRGIFVTR